MTVKVPQSLVTLPANSPDATLIENLKAGDEKALSILYDKYAPALYGIILKIVKQPELAEDVLQECFVKIWINIAQYDAARGRLFTWLLNICRNQAIDKIRSGTYLVGLKTEDITQAKLKNPPSGNETRPEHIGIKEMTEKLKPDQKKIIDMLYFEGFTQSEVAEALNIPLGTVKTRARNAIQLLGKLMK